MHLLRRLAAALLPCVAASVALGVGAAPAHAEDGYTYWGYYLKDGGDWEFAQKGPDALTPEDGAIEGWHFATTVGSQTRPPRTDLTFDEICADAEAAEGEKRVGVLLDYGTTADAAEGEEPPQPEADCAVVPADATGAQVLQSVADVRAEEGLTCAINGYPSTGCGVPVPDATAPATEENVDFAMPSGDSGDSADAAESSAESESGLNPSLIGVGALVLLLVVAGVLVARRRA